MSKTLSEFLVETYNCNLDDLEDTFDFIAYKFETVCEDERDEHRWYTNYRVVKKVVIDKVERYFSYIDCNPKGECTDKEDCGWEIYHADCMVEVFPEEVVKVVYR